MMGSDPEALVRQGYQARRDGRPQEAKACFTEAVGLCSVADDRVLLARALTGLGQIERDLHETAAALRHYEDAVTIYRRLDDPLVLAHTVRHVGDILRNLGKPELATPCFVEALEIYRGRDDAPPLDLANALRGYALAAEEIGEAGVSRELWQEAKALYSQVGVEAGVAEADRRIARLAR